MGIPKFEVDMNIISQIPEYPADGGFTTETFRAEFDKAGLLLQEFINTILIPEFDKTIDVDALIKDILDATLTKSDKAAPAKTVGEKLAQIIRENAALINQTVKSGDYVLKADQNFKTEMLTVNKVRVYGGKYVTQGNLVELNLGGYVDLDVDSGAVGLYRNDLICARYERNSEGTVTNSIVIVKGSSTQTIPSDPAVKTGNINMAGAVVHETPLSRIVWSQTTPAVEVILEAQVPAGDKKTSTIDKTLLSSGWAASETAGFIQTITVPGLTDEKKAKAYPAQPGTLAEKLALAEETAKVRACSRSGNKMTFECWEEVPSLDIPIVVEVYV